MRRIVAAVVLSVGMVGVAAAAEFQPIGTLGMGGAGVARNMGAYASYWNPAGLAFADKTFSMTTGVGVGLRVSDGLANNVDRLSKFTDGDPSTLDNLKNLTVAEDQDAVGEMVNLLTVIKDVETQKGTISLNIDAAVGFQIKKLGFGIFVLSEGFARPLTDLTNILPKSQTSDLAISTTDLVTLAGTTDPTETFFSHDQVVAMEAELFNNGFSVADSVHIVGALEASLANGNTTLPTLTAVQATDTVVNTLAPAFGADADSIDNNKTAVMVKNVAFAEIPISYGHAFKLGASDMLGVGASCKLVRGRVYQTRISLVEDNSVESSDVTDGLRDNYEESTNVTFDLGLLWKHSNWLSVGIVGKNLTSPAFKSPYIKDQNGFYVDSAGVRDDDLAFAGRYRDVAVKLKPQARMGVALDPWKWLTIAGDIDLTENETVLSGLDYKSRHLGGGFEIHTSWLKLRGGIYKNIADDEIGPVATAGLTIGVPWVLLEIDGAYGLDEARYDEKDYPKESRVQAQLSMQF